MAKKNIENKNIEKEKTRTIVLDQPTKGPIKEPVTEHVAQPVTHTFMEDAPAHDAQSEPQDEVRLTCDEFEKVKAHIETLQKEKEESVTLAQRLQADFDNYRKRNSALKKESYDEGTRDCIKALLPTLDNFDRAFLSMAGVDEAFVEGMRLVQRTLLETLQRLGLNEIDAGGKFDANLHNAVMQEAVEGKASGDIIEVLQKGYAVNDKILRYSMVRVAE